MKGARPDAAANEAKLKAIPANTWVRLKTPVALGTRDWGTWVFDPDRDIVLRLGRRPRQLRGQRRRPLPLGHRPLGDQ